jgi:enoyl-CoA hydratase/carnithine racemase
MPEVPETDHALVHRQDEGNLATLTLNRPAAHNAIDRQMAADLAASLSALAADTDLRALIVTGAGDRAFSAGADLKERLALSPEERSAHTAAIAAAADALAALPVPTIAAIHGYALAGGAELALACDLRVAATDALFGFPEVKIGIFPGAGGVARLPRLVGAGAARDLLYTGRQFPAEDAFRLGLVDRLVPDADVGATALALAREIVANAPLAVRALKRALRESAGLPEAPAREAVARHRAPLDATADYAEGLRAFAERRPPQFRGE